MLTDALTVAYWMAIAQFVFALEVGITLAVLGMLKNRNTTHNEIEPR